MRNLSRSPAAAVAAFLAALAIAAVVAPHAQQVRDQITSRPAATGTASISGRVTDPGGSPLRGAIVTLREDSLSLGRTVVTDDEGRFAIDALPEGHVSLAARKPAYVTMNFGARHADQSGTSIALTPGQKLDAVNIALPKGAVLTGTIVDTFGAPMQGLNVFAARRDPARPDDPLTPIPQTATTDDRGTYRLFGLSAGEYVVGASIGQVSMASAISRNDDAVDAMLRALESRATGSDPATRTLAPSEHTSSPGQGAAFSNLYFPGTADSASAQLIRVKLSEERTGIDFVMAPTPTATIEGIVASPPGAGSPSMVLSPQGLQVKFAINMLGPSARLSGPDASGRFIYSGVAPGHYTISAVWSAVSQFASQELDVNGHDITGLQFSPQPAVRLSGRVVVDATDTTAPMPPLTNARLMLVGVGAGSGLVLNGMQIGPVPVRIPTVDASGAVEFIGIVPGEYQIQNPVPFGKLTLQSAVVNGRDLLDVPVDIRSDLSGLVATFSDKHTELSGVLQDPSGAPVADNVIVAMPADRSLWRSARRVLAAQPGTDGRFTFADLPAGDYLLVAVTDLDPADLHDPDLLAALAPAGRKVTVGPGQKVRQDLRVK